MNFLTPPLMFISLLYSYPSFLSLVSYCKNNLLVSLFYPDRKTSD